LQDTMNATSATTVSLKVSFLIVLLNLKKLVSNE